MERSNQDFSWLRALKPRDLSAPTMSFLGWERSNHEFSGVGGIFGITVAAGPFWKVFRMSEKTKTRAGAPSPRHDSRWKRSDHKFSRLGTLRPRVFSAGSAQTMSFLGWGRSDHEFSRLGALIPRVMSAGSAQTTSFLGRERSNHVFSRLGSLKPSIFSAGSA